jgi:phosphoglucomutase
MKTKQNNQILTINTKPILDQKAGTSGLRKKTKVFMQINYLENYIQSIFDAIEIKDKNIALGGDGRYLNKESIQKIVSMAIANGAKSIKVAQFGILSTPAMSNLIRKYQLDYGIILSASHNPAGINGDFGIKLNGSNGAPCPENLADKIYSNTKQIQTYKILDNFKLDIETIHQQTILTTKIEVIDGIADYVLMLKNIFNFDLIKNFLNKNNISLLFNSFCGVGGNYAKQIFHNELGISLDNLLNTESKEDFGNLVADPNPHSAKSFMDLVKIKNIDMGIAIDADGDRNFIFSKQNILEPSDALALVLEYAHLIPYYGKIKGVARSIATSNIVDIVAKTNNIPLYITPTGWKFFGNLLDNNLIDLCGEESFGLGSKHIREKDGLWAIICYLYIMAITNKNLDNLIQDLWKKYDRVYFAREDYENLEESLANKIIENITKNADSLLKQNYNDIILNSIENFTYSDTIDKSVSHNQGLVLNLNCGNIIIRISGTGTNGKTIRIYYYSTPEPIYNIDKHEYLNHFYNYVKKLIDVNIVANVRI